VAVEGAAVDLEDVGDLLDGVAALVVEPLRGRDLRGVEYRPTAAVAAAGAGGGEPVAGVGHD